MTWTVVWKPRVEQRLADIWMRSGDKNVVASAANKIDYDLRLNPLGVGESRGSNDRIHFHSPLGVYYEVIEADRRVNVLGVWRSKSDS